MDKILQFEKKYRSLFCIFLYYHYHGISYTIAELDVSDSIIYDEMSHKIRNELQHLNNSSVKKKFHAL